jgi:hypothetical protein
MLVGLAFCSTHPPNQVGRSLKNTYARSVTVRANVASFWWVSAPIDPRKGLGNEEQKDGHDFDGDHHCRIAAKLLRLRRASRSGHDQHQQGEGSGGPAGHSREKCRGRALAEESAEGSKTTPHPSSAQGRTLTR